jgi:hypothetical protein
VGRAAVRTTAGFHFGMNNNVAQQGGEEPIISYQSRYDVLLVGKFCFLPLLFTLGGGNDAVSTATLFRVKLEQ